MADISVGQCVHFDRLLFCLRRPHKCFGVLINIYEDAKNIYEGLVNRFLPNEKSGKAGKVYD
ncbi:hypothetical protein DXA15_05095 [Parabacteroides sp. AM58-2XD]|nr:hypothetical protein DXA15_05095 [Parabacteroides sp. AM58-2XD]